MHCLVSVAQWFVQDFWPQLQSLTRMDGSRPDRGRPVIHSEYPETNHAKASPIACDLYGPGSTGHGWMFLT